MRLEVVRLRGRACLFRKRQCLVVATQVDRSVGLDALDRRQLAGLGVRRENLAALGEHRRRPLRIPSQQHRHDLAHFARGGGLGQGSTAGVAETCALPVFGPAARADEHGSA